MDILITGASGLIGSALAPVLTAAGHRVVPLRREVTPGDGAPSWDPAAGKINLSSAGSLDAVVHLAGEPIGQRWTDAVKRRIRESRVKATRLLCDALVRLPRPPKSLVCASATGIYGDRGDKWLDESSSAGTGFLADVARDWEAATAPAVQRGLRVVHLRFGIVLAGQGGALAKMLPAFKLGVAGRLGDGRAYWSWIAIEDAVRALDHALVTESLSGPVNAVSPNPVTNLEFTRTLGRVLRRPTFFAMPRCAVVLLFGEMGREALLASVRVKPAKLLASGFEFRSSTLEQAFGQVLRRPPAS